jgi:alkylation response protein AidB-like acyl-CoA dehydrogenase
MILDVDERLLRRAQELEHLIREHAAEAEHERRVGKVVLEALAEAGLFRMLTPRSLGGLETDPVTCARVIEEVSGYDSAAGWTLMTANSADWWCSRLPAQGAEEIYAEDRNAVIASAFHPPMDARAVEGGVRVTGRRPLSSNIHDATWLMVTALVDAGDGGAPQALALYARAAEAEILDTWYTLGMRGTDSNDVSLTDVFVPRSRTFVLAPGSQPGPLYDGPLYRISAMGQAGMVVSPVPLGIARAALDELRRLAGGKTPFGSAKVLRERAVAQRDLARAEAVLRSARLLFYDALAEEWERAKTGVVHTLEQRADTTLAAAHAVWSAATAVDLVCRLAGTTGIYTRSPLERHLRDVQTLRHHGFVAESRYESAGQVYLGVEPEFGFVAF